MAKKKVLHCFSQNPSSFLSILLWCATQRAFTCACRHQYTKVIFLICKNYSIKKKVWLNHTKDGFLYFSCLVFKALPCLISVNWQGVQKLFLQFHFCFPCKCLYRAALGFCKLHLGLCKSVRNTCKSVMQCAVNWGKLGARGLSGHPGVLSQVSDFSSSGYEVILHVFFS